MKLVVVEVIKLMQLSLNLILSEVTALRIPAKQSFQFQELDIIYYMLMYTMPRNGFTGLILIVVHGMVSSVFVLMAHSWNILLKMVSDLMVSEVWPLIG
uniref:Uncharacterized protein n=1 Tax=Panstrongylus lignarius TaxID=156445 RepID=A0A224Y2M4_9HEMI